MSENDHVPARSWLAMAVLKGGLAFGALWMLALLGLVARAVLELV